MPMYFMRQEEEFRPYYAFSDDDNDDNDDNDNDNDESLEPSLMAAARNRWTAAFLHLLKKLTLREISSRRRDSRHSHGHRHTTTTPMMTPDNRHPRSGGGGDGGGGDGGGGSSSRAPSTRRGSSKLSYSGSFPTRTVRLRPPATQHPHEVSSRAVRGAHITWQTDTT